MRAEDATFPGFSKPLRIWTPANLAIAAVGSQELFSTHMERQAGASKASLQ